MSRLKRASKGDTAAESAHGTAVAGISAIDPSNIPEDKSRPNWWLPADVATWRDIPEPQGGEPTKEKSLTVEQLMRREREFHLFGRGTGGQHLPDHSARLIAFIIDNALHVAAFAVAVRVMNSTYPDRLSPIQVKAVAAASAWIVFSFVPLLVWRATPGKLLLGLRVVRADGGEASVAQAVLRGIVVLLAPLALLDVLVVVASPHRRRLIDYFTRTRVVANS